MSRAESLHRTLLLLTLALVSGVVGFGVVVAVLSVGGREATLAISVPVQAMIGAGALSILVAAGFVGSAVSRPEPGSSADAAADRIRTGVIVAMAMRESVGLLGAVLGLLSGELLLMSALVAASAAMMVLGVPGRDALEHTLRRADG